MYKTRLDLEIVSDDKGLVQSVTCKTKKGVFTTTRQEQDQKRELAWNVEFLQETISLTFLVRSIFNFPESV